MLSKKIAFRPLLMASGAAIALATPAYADIDFGISAGALNNTVCLIGTRVTTTQDANGNCTAAELEPTRLSIGDSTIYSRFDATTGAATFTAPVTISNANFQASGLQAFSGTSTFNSTVSFVGPSVTFSTGTTFSTLATFNGLADFNNGITANSVVSTTINSTALTSGSVITDSLLAQDSLVVSNGANVTMGNNIVHGVAAGVVDTDAVNVAQLNAATAGVTADVTALETLTDTHTTQITNLQSTTATHTTQITNLQTGLAITNSNVATNTASIATLQTGLAETNSALAGVDSRVDALEAVTANLDERIDDVAHRSDAGTATAVALSGAMFLPGKTFNLTGNVGAYRGSVAGALQLGVVVSDMVAVNAGVAKGFSKHGKTAARAGFTVGW